MLLLPGRLVPKATNVMAVTSALSPAEHPKELARSPIRAVRNPMNAIATTKHNQPPHIMVGGTKEKSN